MSDAPTISMMSPSPAQTESAPSGLWRDAWTRLRRNRAGVICFGVVCAYLVVGLIGFLPVLERKIVEPVGGSFDPPKFAWNAALWFGTDITGHSVFWEVIYGTRLALTLGIVASLISIIIGTFLGTIAGYFGGWVDALVNWLVSTFISMPWILLAIAIATAMQTRADALREKFPNHQEIPGLVIVIVALSATNWNGLCRLVRGEVLKLRERDYVVAGRAIGLGHWTILRRHIVPNVFHLVIIDFSLGIVANVQAEVVLAFLGLGITAKPSWGRMIDDSKLDLLRGVWWQLAAATVAIFVLSLAMNLLGDALRDALDPRLRGWTNRMPEPLLELKNLNVAFDTERGRVQPVRDVSLSIYPGQTVALVGESGCGKSVTAMSILRLIPSPPGKVLSGEIRFGARDLLALSEREMRSVRGKDIAMIFQEPMTSLNPVYTVGDQIVEAITLHQHVNTTQAYRIAEDALRDVGIADPARRLHTYPHEMSGGMRQRVMIAMALSCQPKLLIADEPTTALDVTIQAQILELLRKLQRERGMAILLITHDLGVVAENADVVAVMYASRIVECATVENLFDNPQHPYTEGLFRSVPKLGAQVERLDTISGTVPNPARFPGGCKFHPRCPLTRELATKSSDTVEITASGERFKVLTRCQSDEPLPREVAPSHWAACHQIPNFDSATQTIAKLSHKRSQREEVVQ